MNIVQVNHIEDQWKRRYTFKVPDGVKLKKGTIVRVKIRGGEEKIAICITDSHVIDDEEVLQMVTGGNNICSKVTAIFTAVNLEWEDK